MTFLLSTAYFAPVSYYACLLRCDASLMGRFLCKPQSALIEQNEHYHKQSYRNRCIIASANGLLSLSVPVVFHNDQPIRDVQIDYRSDWARQHWVSITSAYNSTPYFEYYEDDLIKPFQSRFTFLFDLNEALRETVCGLLDIHPDCCLSTDYMPEQSVEENILDLRSSLHPKKPLSLTNYIPCHYPQVFESRYGFQPDLSILDLLFNMGPEALITLKNSILP